MPELLRIETSDFEFSIWSNDITTRQKAYTEALNKRGCSSKALLDGNAVLGHRRPFIYFSPALKIQDLKFEQVTLEQNQNDEISKIELLSYLFFENVQYQFEWVFLNKVHSAQIAHKNQLLNEGFRFIEAHLRMPARIIGTVNTGNHVGWMRLPLEYRIDDQVFKHELSFEVLPTKMDLHADLPAMYQEIDQVFPLWRFSLVEKTEQNSGKSQHRGQFPLMWLANFAQLRERFEQGLKVVIQAPHSRLQIQHSFIKADRLKGRITHRTGLKIKEDGLNGCFDKRYKIETKKLSVDIPENRFIKSVVTTCKKKLGSFEKAIRASNQELDKQRLSDTFLDELHQWQRPLQKILEQNFFNDVGRYAGLSKESLVLQQKTGYSTVYRVWQDLKFYLDIFGNVSNISLKSVAEIYEIWCFLTLKNILRDELGFEEISAAKNKLVLNEFFEYQLKDGFVGAFEFKRSDGVKARLVHEPKFTKNGREIRSYLVSQEPDIVLEIELSNGKRFIWLFDAKYRIKTEQDRFGAENVNNTDYVPDDAINQMHHYRDALIRVTTETEVTSNRHSKSRPVFGAFALYPGYFDQQHIKNPYQYAIDEIGIGAFALLPNVPESDKNGHYWLLEYLTAKIGNADIGGRGLNTLDESLYMQEPARIPYHGMQQVLHTDLIMTVSLAEQTGRDQTYFNAFNDGTAQWFHLPQDTLVSRYGIHISKEIRYLAIAMPSSEHPETQQIEKIWPIKNVSLIPRNKITKEQAGKNSGLTQINYLFELGQPLLLMNKILRVPHSPIRNSIKLTTLECLTTVNEFTDLESVYISAINYR
ncbi:MULTISPECIES: restriction endonuclease-like protein [Acinetobacter]|uniref:restriction endonuclease-like protein n=1 Tax=Acinetobacter TaxID=469 RepID=UPI00141BB5C0|nr:MULTISPECIES: restriction endonuclease-like protein [Acinetobacter]MCS4298185.1 hypothetical protein [Acinetobacter guillouiae]MCW2251789.1 hypothetical protein [Acinetobacter sp. BIGb0204]NII38443.1 hypothetical protein [Acinetobacter sp. BIGb0196]